MDLVKHQGRHGTVMAVSMMKDEAPFLLEWFAHHLAIGFTDILVYTNDCSDGTVEMLQRLEELGLGHHRHNVIPEGSKPQPSALKHAQEEPLVQAADWVMVFDADEFVVINHPAGHMDGLLDDVVARGANGIVMTWRIFGSNGVVAWSREPVSEQYVRAAPELWNKGWGVKTLFRFDPDHWKLGIHRPSIKSRHLETDWPASVHWLNGSGQPMEDYFKFRGWRSIRRTLGYDWVQVNHYAVKSIDSYAVRKLRGNVNNKKDKYNADYWSLQDRNEVPDSRILRHATERARIMAELLRDPVLRDLHEAALERIEARLAEYRKGEAYVALRDGLIAASRVPITDVEAKPPQARDPVRIAALMSRVERGAVARSEEIAEEERKVGAGSGGWSEAAGCHYIDGRIDLSTPVDVAWASNHQIDLPADQRIFGPDAVMAVLAGKFDRRHARNIIGHLSGSRKLLDLGAGIGLPALRAAREIAGIEVMLHDAQPGMLDAIGVILDRSGTAGRGNLRLISGALHAGNGGLTPAVGLAACLRDFRPDTLRLSQRAGLDVEALQVADMSGVRKVILPFENDAQLRLLHDRFVPVLQAMGLEPVPDCEESGSLRLERTSGS